MTGDARAEEREPRRGRHRRGSGGPTWTPKVSRAVHHRSGSGAPAIPAPHGTSDAASYDTSCAAAEPAVTGLRKFNLGTIPASVTPPRTWRRAAWFAVSTAVLVVLGLGYAAVALVGHPRRGTTIDALPAQPTQHLLITGLPGEQVEPITRPQATAPAPATRTPTSTAASPRPAAPDARARARSGAVPATRPGPGTPDRPATPDAVSTSAAPARSTVGLAPAPPTDPAKMGDRTEAYYANAVSDPEAACALTTGSMRAEGAAGIAARYAGVERIEVKEITIDQDWSYTRSTLVLVHQDGSRTTVRRELRFSHGADPKITSDTPAG